MNMFFYFLFQKTMPRRKSGEEFNFTYVECLLYTFRYLADKVFGFPITSGEDFTEQNEKFTERYLFPVFFTHMHALLLILVYTIPFLYQCSIQYARANVWGNFRVKHFQFFPKEDTKIDISFHWKGLAFNVQNGQTLSSLYLLFRGFGPKLTKY